MKDCSNCQIGPYGGPKDINRPDIYCAVNALVTKLGVWDLSKGKRFFCSVYHEYGTLFANDGLWDEEDQKEYEAVKKMYDELKRR